MWFKNIQLFQFESDAPNAEQLEKALSALPFIPCAKSLPASMGWVAPIGDAESAPLVHAYQHHLLFCMQLEEKLLPPAVLRDKHAERVAEIEEKQQRKMYRDEKLRLKDDLYHTLLGQAFSRTNKLYVYIDTQLGYLVLDTTSQKITDHFISLYSKCLPEFSIYSPDVHSPATLMTRWLKTDGYPAGVHPTHNCVMQNLNNEKSVARFSFTDLGSEGVQKVLHDESQVIQLGLSWREQIQFTLRHDFTISGIKYLEGIDALKQASPAETAEERAATDFTLMAETFRHFLKEFAPAFIKQEEAVAV